MNKILLFFIVKKIKRSLIFENTKKVITMKDENKEELSGYDQLKPLFKEEKCHCLGCDGNGNCSCSEE